MITSRCIDCKACQVACKAENGTPLGQSRNWIKDSGIKGQFPDLHQTFAPGNCMHCSQAPCVRVCPTYASYQRGDGIVSVDERKCIGCKYCLQACPYNARFLNKETGAADKCSFCLHRLEQGKIPSCVNTCLGKARVAGDLNDSGSEVSRLLATYPSRQILVEAGTGPAIFFIDARVPDVNPERGVGNA
jgi:tetrathionate reductase subunit B